jgi:hypothetical protein
MAFSDPISLASGLAYAAPTGGTAYNWRRVGSGIYVADGLGSLDEPRRLVIKNTPPANANDATRWEVQLWQFKNPPATATDAKGDDFLVTSMVCRYYPRSFVAADMSNQQNMLYSFVSGNTTRLNLGES